MPHGCARSRIKNSGPAAYFLQINEFLFRAAGALQLEIAAVSAMFDRKRTASAADGALGGASRPGAVSVGVRRPISIHTDADWLHARWVRRNSSADDSCQYGYCCQLLSAQLAKARCPFPLLWCLASIAKFLIGTEAGPKFSGVFSFPITAYFHLLISGRP